MRTFYLLVANSLAAVVTNNFLWFALRTADRRRPEHAAAGGRGLTA